MRLSEINNEYETIMDSNSSPDSKALKLVEVMTQMEGFYKIPMLRNPEWEKENKSVIAMYRNISRSRFME
ncbi:hypothetical protein [Alkalihalobacillus sp. LMS39]|uniref:hypothetical protein n=1 Tax=Alkalihalobacillus sp. LMS39 TaxID=2924032 RepID=UPI001FB3001E|nr:hypothetical protein [Alkalihalobacillus sp. LMS39]UOE95093.1 hypothetical protein MM271_05560 [Alkalihalobacillus sp. LMS39]